METPRFLQHKVERALQRDGSKFSFMIPQFDEYNQPVEEGETVEITGVYHELNSFISLTTGDAASVQRKKSPMILTLFTEDVRKLAKDSKVSINNVEYKITGVLDVQNYGLVADISLEMEV